ncbi:hypothetical protein AB0F20_35715 [Streptomyces goshikiensis]|uniref:hypothetical protein n=1 Tax=Streptomyces goshikiensis TaxID=1942 RepID=UPI0033D71D9E
MAEELGVSVRAVLRAARTDTGLALALAGVDPEGADAVGVIGRADYLRLLALGASPSLASQILFDGSGQSNTWRAEQTAFAAACDAVVAATASRAERRPSRFTPERRRHFLDHLAAGMATTKAPAEVGVTTATVYQRRRRDASFAAVMDQATTTRTPEPPALPRTRSGSPSTNISPFTGCSARPPSQRASGPKPSTTDGEQTPTSRNRPTNCARDRNEQPSVSLGIGAGFTGCGARAAAPRWLLVEEAEFAVRSAEWAGDGVGDCA